MKLFGKTEDWTESKNWDKTRFVKEHLTVCEAIFND